MSSSSFMSASLPSCLICLQVTGRISKFGVTRKHFLISILNPFVLLSSFLKKSLLWKFTVTWSNVHKWNLPYCCVFCSLSHLISLHLKHALHWHCWGLLIQLYSDKIVQFAGNKITDRNQILLKVWVWHKDKT